jgi:hypothetical protein
MSLGTAQGVEGAESRSLDATGGVKYVFFAILVVYMTLSVFMWTSSDSSF